MLLVYKNSQYGVKKLKITSNYSYNNYYKNNKAIPNYSKNAEKIAMCGYEKIYQNSLPQKGFLVRLKDSVVNLFRTKNQEKNVKADKDLASINRNLESIITNNTAENVKVDRIKEFYIALMSKENILKPLNKNKDTFAHCATYEEWEKIYNIYKDDPDMLVKIYTAKNAKGNFPIYKILLSSYSDYSNYNHRRGYIDIMNRALKDNPDVLVKIYTENSTNVVSSLDGRERSFLYELYEKTGSETLLEQLIFGKRYFDGTGVINELNYKIAFKYLKNKPDMLLGYLGSKLQDGFGNIMFSKIRSDDTMAAISNKLVEEYLNKPDELYKLYSTIRKLEPSTGGCGFRDVHYETIEPKDTKFTKMFLIDIIKLVRYTNLAPDKAEKLLNMYYRAAGPCRLEKEFDILRNYCKRVQLLPDGNKKS